MGAASELVKLAEKKFGKFTVAEKKLFRAAAKGEIADYSPRSKKPIDPANAAKWGPSRVLLADRIAWLCTDKQASQLVTHCGIRIKGARIDREFDLLFAKVPFPLYFELCKFTENICLRYAQLPALNMHGTYTGPISADGLRTDGPVYLREGFMAEGEVRLLDATIAGDLGCGNARFINEGAKAFSADGLNVAGSVFLQSGFRAEGEVRLIDATVGRGLNCRGGKFTNENGDALLADGLKVARSVFLCNGFKAEGGVCLRGAKIDGNLECDNGQFINQGGRALSADGLEIGGSAFLRDSFKTEGLVSLVSATIHGHFVLADVDSPQEMTLDLNSAKIGTLHDNQESWPDTGQLLLHGLEYNEISNESPRDAETRIEWLRLQDDYWPQPYEHLAKVLRDSGDGAGARDVLVAKNKDKATRTKLTFAEKCWYRFFGPLIGYGHKPWLALRLALVIILFGLLFFKQGYSHGLITPPSESAYVEGNDGTRRISEVYPVFNSLVYSIDVFVPVVDLRQAKYWLPNANRGSELVPTSSAALCWGGVLLFWLWIETACGWILTTLILVGLTGLVRT